MTHERALELIQQALDRSLGDYHLEDVVRFIAEGKLQLWATENSVAVTEVIVYPRKKAVLVLLAAGDLDEIRESIPMIEDFAKAIGADRITLCGRRGWVRALEKEGFVEQHTWASKEVTP